MAIVSENIFFKTPINKYRLRAVLWVIGAIAILILMVLLWMFSKTIDDDKREVTKTAPANSVQNINITNKITELNDLSYSIKPIEFKTIIRDLRSYPDEFKDHRYLKDRKGKWTLQIMNVEAHDVITDYLDSRSDREAFAYFRYTDENNHQRYVLMYETFDNLEKGIDNSKSTDFALPKSVKIIPEEINRYLSMIDNYERAEEVHDMSGSRPRNIILHKTSRELPVKRVIPKAKPKPKVKTYSKPKKSSGRSSAYTKQSLSSGNSSKSMVDSTKKTKQPTVKAQLAPKKPQPTKNSSVNKPPSTNSQPKPFVPD